MPTECKEKNKKNPGTSRNNSIMEGSLEVASEALDCSLDTAGAVLKGLGEAAGEVLSGLSDIG